jgi:hypothetical protein
MSTISGSHGFFDNIGRSLAGAGRRDDFNFAARRPGPGAGELVADGF